MRHARQILGQQRHQLGVGAQPDTVREQVISTLKSDKMVHEYSLPLSEHWLPIRDLSCHQPPGEGKGVPSEIYASYGTTTAHENFRMFKSETFGAGDGTYKDEKMPWGRRIDMCCCSSEIFIETTADGDERTSQLVAGSGQ